jgi:antitoxin MazE
MANVIKTNIVKIGNSQGVRIPKRLLEQANIDKAVELEIQDGRVIIRSASVAREGWEGAFKAMAAAGDDALLDE